MTENAATQDPEVYFQGLISGLKPEIEAPITPVVDSVLKELEEFERKNPRMRNVTREGGLVLKSLITASNAKDILELGTSNGYSTIWLAMAARETGGKVTTVENQKWKIDLAKSNLQKVGLAKVVDFVLGDAREKIEGLKNHVDFLFLDIWPDEYLPCLTGLMPKLKPMTLIVADNMLTHRDRDGNITPRGEEGNDYLEFIQNQSKFLSKDLEIGSGLNIAMLK